MRNKNQRAVYELQGKSIPRTKQRQTVESELGVTMVSQLEKNK